MAEEQKDIPPDDPVVAFVDPNIETLKDTNFTVIQAEDYEDRSEAEAIAKLKDKPRCWLVVFAGFILQVIIVGVLHVFGVFFVVIKEEFNCSSATAAWVGSLAYGLSMFLGPVVSILQHKIGNRRTIALGSVICSISLIVSSFMPNIESLYVTFGLLYGIGVCFAYTPTMTIASDFFDKHISLATGITVAGSSTGTLVLSPLTELAVAHFGWRNTFRGYSVAVLVGVWSGWMCKPLVPPKKPSCTSTKIKKSIARPIMAEVQLWKNRVFIVWIAATTCTMFGYYVPYVHLVAHALTLGISSLKSSVLLMLFGGATATGRCLFGKVVSLGILNQLHMHQLSMVVTGTMCIMLPMITHFYGLVAYVIIVGLVDGCFIVLLPVLTTFYFGSENKATAWGFVISLNSITFTLGPPVAGWIFDATGSYSIAFHVLGIPIICGAIILLFIPWAQRTATTTNVMAAAREAYEITVQDDGADVFGEGDMPMDVYPMSPGPASLKTSSIDVPKEGGNPVILVDVTEVVRQKVEEVLASYRQQSVLSIQMVPESPLTNLANPTFISGTQNTRGAPRFVVGTPINADVNIKPIQVSINVNDPSLPGNSGTSGAMNLTSNLQSQQYLRASRISINTRYGSSGAQRIVSSWRDPYSYMSPASRQPFSSFDPRMRGMMHSRTNAASPLAVTPQLQSVKEVHGLEEAPPGQKQDPQKPTVIRPETSVPDASDGASRSINDRIRTISTASSDNPSPRRGETSEPMFQMSDIDLTLNDSTSDTKGAPK